MVVGAAGQTLFHYCFSCRTLGMLVEHWVYDFLRRPQIDVVGEVLTDLTQKIDIDWITVSSSVLENSSSTSKVAKEIRVHGGCEANAVAHYLAAYCEKIEVTGNFAAGNFFVRVNSGALLLSASDHKGYDCDQESSVLDPSALMGCNYFADVPDFTIFVFSGGLDAGAGAYYRHRSSSWDIKIELNGFPRIDFIAASDEDLRMINDLKLPATSKTQINEVIQHIRDNYVTVKSVANGDLPKLMDSLFERVPSGSKFIIVLDDDRVRSNDGTLRVAPWITRYNDQMKSIVAPFRFVEALEFKDFIEDENEIQIGGNHYHRMVYCRLAEAIITTAQRLPGKMETPVSCLDEPALSGS